MKFTNRPNCNSPLNDKNHFSNLAAASQGGIHLVKYFCVKFMLCLLLAFTHSFNLSAQEKKHWFEKIEAGVEYYFPEDKEDRNIKTINLDLLAAKEFLKKKNITLATGITISHGFGNSKHIRDDYQVFVNKEAVIGIGPAVLGRLVPFRYKNLSPSFDACGGLIIYNKQFPAGGDYYNFMWRYGFSLHYRKNNYSFSIQARKMHVSNGQGLGPQNPSYDSRGIGISISKYL